MLIPLTLIAAIIGAAFIILGRLLLIQSQDAHITEDEAAERKTRSHKAISIGQAFGAIAILLLIAIYVRSLL